MSPLAIAEQAAAVTTDDANDLPDGPCLWLYIGVSGDVKATVGGNPVVFKAAPVGPLWVRAARVWATGTTATNILAMN